MTIFEQVLQQFSFSEQEIIRRFWTAYQAIRGHNAGKAKAEKHPVDPEDKRKRWNEYLKAWRKKKKDIT